MYLMKLIQNNVKLRLMFNYRSAIFLSSESPKIAASQQFPP